VSQPTEKKNSVCHIFGANDLGRHTGLVLGGVVNKAAQRLATITALSAGRNAGSECKDGKNEGQGNGSTSEHFEPFEKIAENLRGLFGLRD